MTQLIDRHTTVGAPPPTSTHSLPTVARDRERPPAPRNLARARTPRSGPPVVPSPVEEPRYDAWLIGWHASGRRPPRPRRVGGALSVVEGELLETSGWLGAQVGSANSDSRLGRRWRSDGATSGGGEPTPSVATSIHVLSAADDHGLLRERIDSTFAGCAPSR
jgi:hypothetical protein